MRPFVQLVGEEIMDGTDKQENTLMEEVKSLLLTVIELLTYIW